MPDELLIAALAQAEQSDPSLKGIALLHIARVMTVDDRARARQLMEEGIAIITGLPENQRSVLLNEAVPLAGTVSPQRALDLIPMVSSAPGLGQIGINRVILEFMSHGYVKEAVEYLGEPRPDWDYPYTAAFDAIGRSAHDPVAQLRILRGAITAILSAERRFADMDFLQLFKWHWKILPEAELAAVVQMLVERFLEEPDQSGDMNSGGAAGHVHFSSVQQWRLFEIFAPLRRTDPDLAESLVHKFEQLSDAVKRYPDGYDERQTEVPATVEEDAPKCGVDIEWDDMNFRWIPVSEWVEQILPRKLESALDLYRFDVTPDPNKAPRECWPSTQELRSILYRAGRHQGEAAVKLLDRIPDPGVRLLVQIELCAALAGLSQTGGASIPRQTGENEKNTQLPMVTAESVRWKERGIPRRVQVETARWIAEDQTWAPPVRTFSAVYRPDGQAEQTQREDPDGSATHCEFDYDTNGRPTAIWSLLDSGDVEQTAYSYDEGERSVRIAKVSREPETAVPPPTDGGVFAVSTTWVSVESRDDSYDIVGATSILMKYDSQNLPIEVSYFGPGQQLQARKTFRWDSDGRLVQDQLILAFGDLVGLDSMPHWETTYQYDSEGRQIERRRRLGPDFEVRTTFTYDGHRNVVESIDSGKVPGLRHIRYEYRYDDRGNWIERVTKNRSSSDFDPMLKEVRQIEY